MIQKHLSLFSIMYHVFRSTMNKSCFMENWTSSVTQTWWTLPWMCTEVFILTRKFPIVSVFLFDTHHKELLHYTTYSIHDRFNTKLCFMLFSTLGCTCWFMMMLLWLMTFFNPPCVQLWGRRGRRLWPSLSSCSQRQNPLWKCLRTLRQQGRCSQQGKKCYLKQYSRLHSSVAKGLCGTAGWMLINVFTL